MSIRLFKIKASNVFDVELFPNTIIPIVNTPKISTTKSIEFTQFLDKHS